ncbi:uncharacterized protein [Nicotiana sylvestris]|uniref:uncharacterized protein n=1 Tax=Nicotiana sylvestris TaxID=4096 RepID=UPI00388C6407
MSAPPRNWEEQSTARPPLFNGQYYSWWKNRMSDHIIGEDYELWDIVTDGPLAIMKKNAEGVDVPKTRADCTSEDLKKVLPVSWESKITTIQESKNIVTLKLDELIENRIACELRRKTMKMDAPKKERSLTFRITEGVDLEEDEMTMITKDFKKYLMRGKGPSRSRSYNKPRVQPKKNKGSTKDMVAAWGESSDKDSEDEDGDEQTLIAIGESDEESEVNIIHLKDKIKFSSKERLSKLLLNFIDESEDLNNENEQLSKECVILKAKCKNLELRACESECKNVELKNQVHELDTTVLEHRFENLKLKLGTGKKKADHTQFTLEENVGKIKDELYKRGDNEEIGLIRNSNGETTVQPEDASQEGTSDGTGPSTQDEPGSSVDQKLYRGMIGSLLYLTTSRPEIIFSIGLCARFQENPKKSHLTAKEESGSSETEYVSSNSKVSPETISKVATNLENRFVGSITGVETTESGEVGGKKKRESKGARSTVRGKGTRVADSSPTPVSLTKDVGAMIVWGDEPGSSVEETLADLQKKVTESYNPVPVNSKVRALVQESGAKDVEIERLKKRLVEVETKKDALRTELAREKEKNDDTLQGMLKLLQVKNQAPISSQP